MFSTYIIGAIVLLPLSVLVFSLLNSRLRVFRTKDEKEQLVGMCLFGSLFWPIALPIAAICLVIFGLTAASLWIQDKVDP